MQVSNADIAQRFEEIAALLSLQDDQPFRVRAYRKAADQLRSMQESVSALFATSGIKGVRSLPSIGKDLAEKIAEMVQSGTLQFLTELRQDIPVGLLDVMAVQGMGPKRAREVWKILGVQTVDDLERVANDGSLAALPGWGEKSVERIVDGIRVHRTFAGRVLFDVAMNTAERVVAELRSSGLCERIEVAGSVRRGKETIGDVDILAASQQPERVMDTFCALPVVEAVIVRGSTKSSVRLHSGIQADLRIVDAEVFGAALHYFTGSKQHNIKIRSRGLAMGVTISEYGVHEGTAKEKGALLASKTEEDVYAAVGLPFIPPELREDRGEVEAAAEGKLPRLLTLDAVRGDLHLHTDWSDGSASMVDMARAAEERGLEYIAITDHASGMGMVRGIKDHDIDRYLSDIVDARQAVQSVRLLAGCEVDIQKDGLLYLSDASLSAFDWVVASVHQWFDLPPQEQTERLLRAIAHPAVRVIAHPTARLLLQREPLVFDIDAVFAAAARENVAMEINASSARLDLSDILARTAAHHGVRMALGSDAHHPRDITLLPAVMQARRAWLEPHNVLNTLSAEELLS